MEASFCRALPVPFFQVCTCELSLPSGAEQSVKVVRVPSLPFVCDGMGWDEMGCTR